MSLPPHNLSLNPEKLHPSAQSMNSPMDVQKLNQINTVYPKSGSESPLVNGHPSLATASLSAGNSNSSSRQHSPTPFSNQSGGMRHSAGSSPSPYIDISQRPASAESNIRNLPHNSLTFGQSNPIQGSNLTNGKTHLQSMNAAIRPPSLSSQDLSSKFKSDKSFNTLSKNSNIPSVPPIQTRNLETNSLSNQSGLSSMVSPINNLDINFTANSNSSILPSSQSNSNVTTTSMHSLTFPSSPTDTGSMTTSNSNGNIRPNQIQNDNAAKISSHFPATLGGTGSFQSSIPTRPGLVPSSAKPFSQHQGSTIASSSLNRPLVSNTPSTLASQNYNVVRPASNIMGSQNPNPGFFPATNRPMMRSPIPSMVGPSSSSVMRPTVSSSLKGPPTPNLVRTQQSNIIPLAPTNIGGSQISMTRSPSMEGGPINVNSNMSGPVNPLRPTARPPNVATAPPTSFRPPMMGPSSTYGPPTSYGPGTQPFPPHSVARPIIGPPSLRPSFSGMMPPRQGPPPSSTHMTGYMPPSATGPLPPSNNMTGYLPPSVTVPPPPPSNMTGYLPPSATGPPPPPTNMTSYLPPSATGPPPPPNMTGYLPPSATGPPPSSSNMTGYMPPSATGPPPMSSAKPSMGSALSGGMGGRYPGGQQPTSINKVSQQLGGLSVTRDGWNKSWGTNPCDLLQLKTVLPPEGVVPPKPTLLQEYLPNCSPDIFRCTIAKIPESQSVLQKSRLPFGVLIHPFKDLEHLAVVSCNTIVRCRSCRTYINPFVVFKGERKWECNLCYRVNELPDEFQFDPLTRTYGDPSRRPEVREATIEFIAPQEYMLRPPQPATYVWVLDVSRQAIDTGYLKIVCDALLSNLDDIPGDRRTLMGFITYSTTVQFYLMGEGQNSVQMLEVGEIDDIFIPNPHDLLVHLDESRPLIEELLTSLPETHANNVHTQTALGSALTAAYKLISHIGGRITTMAVTLPTIGPGALKPREDPNQRSAKDISNLGPATDFYKKLALDCSGQQIAVDLFTLNSHYIDLATLSGMSKFSGGCIHHFPMFNVTKNPASVEPFKSCLDRYVTRKIGFEAVMRIRATRGLAITNFHGNFFVRSTDLLSLPNINPDAGFGMQVNIEEPLHNLRQACFQAALLYTSSRGERRIRVHTLCLPVSPNVHEIINAGDQQAIVDLLGKMAVDKCLSSQMSDAREAVVNACGDVVSAYKASLSSSQAGLPVPSTLQVLPLYLLSLLKSVALRHGISTKLDDRVFAMCELKMLPLKHTLLTLYPDLFPIHNLNEKGAISVEDSVIPQPGRLHLSAEYIDRNGAYLMDAGSTLLVYVRSGISNEWVNDALGVPSYAAIPQPLYQDPFPVLDNALSDLLRNFISHLQRSKSYLVPVYVIKEDNPNRSLFIQNLIDDRSEGAHSYVEFLQFIKSQVK